MRSVDAPGTRAISPGYLTLIWARDPGRATFTAAQEHEKPKGGMPAEWPGRGDASRRTTPVHSQNRKR
jgi:hypothetical protein